MDLPHLPVHEGGTVRAEEVHHFWRSLEQWGEELEALAAGCPCIGFTAVATAFSDASTTLAVGATKELNLTLTEEWGDGWVDSGTGSIDTIEHGVYHVIANVVLSENTGTTTKRPVIRLVDKLGNIFGQNSTHSVQAAGIETELHASGHLTYTTNDDQGIGVTLHNPAGGTRTFNLDRARITAFKLCECVAYDYEQGS
jgi:hypothetical protein